MMNKVELLAPAGDFDSLIAAVSQGANAIYIGGPLFGARAYAHNFTIEDIHHAVEYAHLRGVRIFVTVNTLIYDEEIGQVLDYIKQLYEAQVDALLIQDIGLLNLVRTLYPDLEIHISTQMTLHSPYGLDYFERLGVKRIVLSRECSVEEIKTICASTSMEVEVFVHGALCVCYSGQCHMSGNIGGRSGNRGQCAQPCRLKYQLVEDGHIIGDKTYLSPKDLMVLYHIDELIDAGVASFKIEGRMKKPEYVAAAVRTYRNAIDHKEPQPQDILDLKQMFNRDYTTGWIFNDPRIVAGDFSGHHGIIIGQAISYSKKFKTVRIKLNGDLKQGDSILFEEIDAGRPVNKMMIKGKLVNSAQKGDIVDIEFNQPVYKGNVRKTVSVDTIKRLQGYINEPHTFRMMDLTLDIEIGKPMKLTGTVDGSIKTIIDDTPIEEASKQPTSKERLIQQLKKMGGTIYHPGMVDVTGDENGFVPIKIVNEMRRNIIQEFDDEFAHKIIHKPSDDITLKAPYKSDKTLETIVIVSTIEQLKIALSEGFKTYISYDARILNKCLDCFAAFNQQPGFVLPRIVRAGDYKALCRLTENDYRFIVNEFSMYEKLKDRDIIIGTGFNVINSYTSSAFAHPAIISYECDHDHIVKINQYSDVYEIVYGRDENMISEHCVISQHYFKEKRPHCGQCQKHKYQLIDHKGAYYPIKTDEHCRMHILNKSIRQIPMTKNLPSVIILTTENSKQAESILKIYHKNNLE